LGIINVQYYGGFVVGWVKAAPSYSGSSGRRRRWDATILHGTEEWSRRKSVHQ
jgi:hypothetical protein